MSATETQSNKSRFSFALIQPFIIRAVILFFSWKLLYTFILLPYGIPNDWLTKFTEDSVATVLSLVYDNVTQYNHAIYANNVETVIIAPECNGLEVFILYIGLMLCIPTNWKRLLAFSAMGIVSIFILNVLRSAALATMYYHHNYFVNFAHHYAFKLVIYGVVFLYWVWYTKALTKHEA